MPKSPRDLQIFSERFFVVCFGWGFLVFFKDILFFLPSTKVIWKVSR